MELDIPYDQPAPTRRRGDFRRRGDQGPPVVKSLTKTRKRQGPGGAAAKKADLQALADAAGIDHTGMTVPQLHEALGPEQGDDVYGRPSGYGDTIEPMWNLMKHHEREIVFGLLGVSDDDINRWANDLYHVAGEVVWYDAVSDNPDARRILDRIAARSGDLAGRHNAADRGTYLHALTEWAEDHRTELMGSTSSPSDGGES